MPRLQLTVRTATNTVWRAVRVARNHSRTWPSAFAPTARPRRWRMSAHPTVATTPSASPCCRSTPTTASSSSRRSCCRSCSRRGDSRPCSTCSSLERGAHDDAAEHPMELRQRQRGRHAIDAQDLLGPVFGLVPEWRTIDVRDSSSIARKPVGGGRGTCRGSALGESRSASATARRDRSFGRRCRGRQTTVNAAPSACVAMLCATMVTSRGRRPARRRSRARGWPRPRHAPGNRRRAARRARAHAPWGRRPAA